MNIIETVNLFAEPFKQLNINLTCGTCSATKAGEYETAFTRNKDDKTVILFSIMKNNISVEPKDRNINNVQLAKLVKYKFKTIAIDAIVDVMEFILTVINQLKKYCVGCSRDLGDNSAAKYITCGDIKCSYAFENVIVDNEITEFGRQNGEIMYLLLLTGKYAITTDRRTWIFEPFPQYFLKQNTDTKELDNVRGELSSLKNVNYNEQKDFAKLDSIINGKTNIDDIINVINKCDTDIELIMTIGTDMYYLIKFIIASNKLHLFVDETMDINKRFVMYRVDNGYVIEDEFKKRAEKTCFLFHGSSMENWYSIMRNGLKVCSNTTLMTTGAKYGTGIYLSDSFAFSCEYSRGDVCVMGVYEVIGDKDMHRKAHSIYVVEKPSDVILRYLITVPQDVKHKVAEKVTDKFNILIKQEKQAMTKKIASKGQQKLMKELAKLQYDKTECLGFKIDLRDDNLYIWDVKIFSFDDKYPIAQDMKTYNIKEIHMELTFSDQYPYQPPFCRIISPRFEYRTAHVTSGGSICLELLTPQGWSPACTIESLLVQIKALIVEGEGRLDTVNYKMPYTLDSAKKSFELVARGHGWL
ncbi:MAG: ubiquitin-conjugating enzyme E2 [Faunusvirus sp.]|uniref:E2 ubiquitin-conjugating enzyme n=1 Tax=Faunusvirus sp. TaxID=2487766 RepID=A0A3G4ZY73_9VIRU|nr:MAG: ubiquitin-conjugating enzyme E2 [Faunusvirus sp.]